MATLHVISSSPFTDTRLGSCLRTLGPEDGLLLCGAAVQALRPGTVAAQQLGQLASTHLYALNEDCEAHGVEHFQAQGIDYPQFVELSLTYDRVNTWL